MKITLDGISSFIYSGTMRYTNQHSIPEPIVRAIQNDEYSKGDSVLSVTQLITPPRIVILQDVNADNISVDVVNRVPALFGTAVHKIIEKGALGLEGHIVEERMFLDVNGWKISGAVDLQIDKGNGEWEINDYKVVSVYSVMSEKIEWEQQLNCYAYLARRNHGRNVTSLKIVAILRDWQRRQAQILPSYPQSQIHIVDIPVWSLHDQEAFVHGRVILHQEARKAVDNGEPLVYCTDQERWLRNEAWAVMKEGRKSAIKLHDNKEGADQAVRELGDGHRVDHRPGNYVRCEGNLCLVAPFCKQWAESRPQSGDGYGDGEGSS